MKDNYLRAELSYLVKKGLVERIAGRYKIKRDLRLKDLERLVDIGRSRAGKKRWRTPSRIKNWKPKHSINVVELMQKYNRYNLIGHIKALIRKDELRALATLIYFGGGLRPSDRVVELGFKEGSFYAIVYETKLSRFRLICEEYDELWRELLKDEEIREWLLELIRRHNEWLLQWLQKREYKWRISRDEWDLMASSIKRKKKKIARRIYLAYQPLNGQATILTLKSNKPLVVGIHLDNSNDEYYVR